MNVINNKIFHFFTCICMAYTQEVNYLDFEIIVNDDPYPANMFMHNLSHVSPITGTMPRYMAIVDPLMNPNWVVNSGHLGLDFKVQQENLSYFDCSILIFFLVFLPLNQT